MIPIANYTMRLLNTNNFEVKEFCGYEVPQYAILSHTWIEEEVTLRDMEGNALLPWFPINPSRFNMNCQCLLTHLPQILRQLAIPCKRRRLLILLPELRYTPLYFLGSFLVSGAPAKKSTGYAPLSAVTAILSLLVSDTTESHPIPLLYPSARDRTSSI
jgi:hypothetical protein